MRASGPQPAPSPRLPCTRPAFVCLLLTCAAVRPAPLDAQQLAGILTGTIIDSRGGAPVAGARVSIDALSRADTTGPDGVFVLDSIPVGYWDARIDAPGYLSRVLPSRQVLAGRNRAEIVELDKDDAVHDMGKVVVTAARVSSRSSGQSTSAYKLGRAEILTAPGAAQDIAQVLQSMPSVAGAAHEGFTRLLVRGGDEDENVLLVDDIEVNTLSHWGNPYEPGGGVSILHPDYVASVTFYAGGVPVEYPPLLSAATDIRFREGSKEHRTWQFDLNTGGMGLLLEGPIVRNHASYIVNGRVGVTYLVSKIAGLAGVPEYQNGQAKLVWDMTPTSKLAGNLLIGHERLRFCEEQASGGSEHYNDGLHVAGGIQWLRQMRTGQNKLLLSAIYHKIAWSDTWNETFRDAAWDLRDLRVQLKDDCKVFLRGRDVLSLGITAENLILD